MSVLCDNCGAGNAAHTRHYVAYHHMIKDLCERCSAALCQLDWDVLIRRREQSEPQPSRPDPGEEESGKTRRWGRS
jgi:hypothetical protein